MTLNQVFKACLFGFLIAVAVSWFLSGIEREVRLALESIHCTCELKLL